MWNPKNRNISIFSIKLNTLIADSEHSVILFKPVGSYLSRLLLIGHTISQTSSPCCSSAAFSPVSFSLSFPLAAQLHLEQVHVGTGGPSSYVSFHWAEWLSWSFDVPLQERLAVSAGARCCFLSGIQASPRGTLFPHVAISWSAIDYVSAFICMNVLSLSSALHSSDEEMLIQLCPEAVIFLWRVLGNAPWESVALWQVKKWFFTPPVFTWVIFETHL